MAFVVLVVLVVLAAARVEPAEGQTWFKQAQVMTKA